MSGGAELKIVLVGGDETEQGIINGRMPSRDAELPETHAKKPATPEVTRPEQSPTLWLEPKPGTTPVEPKAERPRDDQGKFVATKKDPQNESTEAVTKDVIDSLDKLAKYINKLVSEPSERPKKEPVERKPSEKPPTTLQRLDSAKEDAGPIVSMLKRFIPQDVLDLGSWARKTFEKYSSRESSSPTVPNLPVTSAKPVAEAPVARVAATPIAQGNVAMGAARAAPAAGGGGAGAAGALVANPALLALAATAAIAAIELKLLYDATSRATDQLRNFSPDIQGVDARTEMRRAQASVRRAQEFGPALARVQDTKDRAAEAIEKLGWAVFKPMLELIDKMLPLVQASSNGVLTMAEGIDAGVAAVKLLASVNPLLGINMDEAGANFTKELKQFTDRLTGMNAPAQDDGLFGGLDDTMKMILTAPLGGQLQPPKAPDKAGNFP